VLVPPGLVPPVAPVLVVGVEVDTDGVLVVVLLSLLLLPQPLQATAKAAMARVAIKLSGRFIKPVPFAGAGPAA
jgi:hypothetical protein